MPDPLPRPLRTAPLLLAALALVATGCGASPQESAVGSTTTTTSTTTAPAPTAAGDPAPPAPATSSPSADATLAQDRPTGTRVAVREVGRRPHDASAFTQGFELSDDGRLFESRGLYAEQEDVILTEVDPEDPSRVLRQVERPAGDEAFYEGLTVVGDRIVQLTWRSGVAHEYDVDTLERTATFTYEGEGWGICDQPDRFVMSDGTATLTFRDLETFEPLGEVEVTLDGEPVEQLNELECVDGLVWANVWQTATIVVVDPASGEVVTVVDASAIAGPRGRSLEDPTADVLNGIAYEASTGTWLLTGKQWPTVHEVEFDCLEGCAATPSHYRRPRPRTASNPGPLPAGLPDLPIT